MNSKTHIIKRRTGKITGGFTLLELLVTLAVLGILMAMGLPELNTFLKNSRLTTQTNTFISVLNFARSEAINRGDNLFITALDVTDNANEWGSGWKIWVDGIDSPTCNKAPDGVLDENDAGCNEVLKTFSFPDSRITINMTESFSNISAANVASGLQATTLMFRGGAGTPALKGQDTRFITFEICDDRKQELGRSIRVNRITGRVSMMNNEHQCS